MPAERGRVLAALRGHGLSGMAAAAVWAEARELVRSTRRRCLEHATTLDADDGTKVGRTLTGTKSSTDLTPHLMRFAHGREYVQVHTHPRSSSFSDLDLLVLVTQPAIRAMAAVGINGTWYVVSRTTSFVATDRRAIVGEYLAEVRKAEAEGVAASERAHTAMGRVASRHGVRYDRVTGPDYE